MREILFKAKRIDNGEWIEGCYLKKYDFLGKEVHFIFLEYRPIAWRCIEVDPDTICQFTGLYNKNRKKIWENDIIKYHFREIYAPIKYGCYQNCFDSTLSFGTIYSFFSGNGFNGHHSGLDLLSQS